MRITTIFLVALVALSIQAADIVPLDVKIGQWEVTSTGSVTGLPPIPPDVLAKMKPEQRARMEANMKGMAGKPQVSKHCVTKQDLSNAGAWGSEDKSCKRTIVTSSRVKQEIRFECARENGTSSGTMRIEAVNSESVKGSVQVVSSGNGQTMNINSTFTAKWLAPACTKEE